MSEQELSVNTKYLCPTHGKAGCCTGVDYLNLNQVEQVKRCACGSRMVRWHKAGPLICPRCGPDTQRS